MTSARIQFQQPLGVWVVGLACCGGDDLESAPGVALDDLSIPFSEWVGLDRAQAGHRSAA